MSHHNLQPTGMPKMAVTSSHEGHHSFHVTRTMVHPTLTVMMAVHLGMKAKLMMTTTTIVDPY